jgi:hypothetical protein
MGTLLLRSIAPAPNPMASAFASNGSVEGSGVKSMKARANCLAGTGKILTRRCVVGARQTVAAMGDITLTQQAGFGCYDRRLVLRPISYKRHRFPPEIIGHAVWLYFRFPLSLRLVEEMLLERGILVSYETISRWALKFGADYTRRLKRKAPSCHDMWHLDEVVISINGERRCLGAPSIRTVMSSTKSCKSTETQRPRGHY